MNGGDAAHIDGVYMISVVAALSGYHPQTLRHYERVGLLRPARSDGGTRRYRHSDLARLQRIRELSAAGVNVAGIGIILHLQDRVEALTRCLDQQQQQSGDATEQFPAASQSRCNDAQPNYV